MTSKPAIRLFCSDLDGTLLGNPESTLRFNQVWEELAPEQRPLLAEMPRTRAVW
jgi:sucrose-6-phosphatase